MMSRLLEIASHVRKEYVNDNHADMDEHIFTGRGTNNVHLTGNYSYTYVEASHCSLHEELQLDINP